VFLGPNIVFYRLVSNNPNLFVWATDRVLPPYKWSAVRGLYWHLF